MATISLSQVTLFDTVPGAPIPGLGKPADGWCGTTHSCITTPAYPLGTKITQYEEATKNPGPYTMCYMRFHDGTDASNGIGDVSDSYRVCFHAEGTATADGSIGGTYVVTNDLTNSDGTVGGFAVLAAAELSSDQCGWFWCGGVCPVTDVTKLNAELKTNGDVLRGSLITLMWDDTGYGIAAPACLTVMYDETNIGDITHPAMVHGLSLNVDA